MKYCKKSMYFSTVLILFILACSGTRKTSIQEENPGEKKYAVFTKLTSSGFKVMTDKGELSGGGGYVPYTGGLLGAAIFGALQGLAENSRNNYEMGGKPKILKKIMEEFPIERMVDNSLYGELSRNFHISRPYELGNIKPIIFQNTSRSRREYRKKCNQLKKKFNIDYLIEINYLYGIIVYHDGLMPSPGLVTELIVRDTQSFHKTIDTVLCSDAYYRRNYSIDEMAANNGELYKDEIQKAADGLAKLIAIELGADISTKEKSFWNDK